MRKNYTLLYTDVVDSTAVNSRLGDTGMAVLWNEHDRRSRELLRQWRGSEIDRSDGFLVLFDSPPDAVAFALAYHRMLTTLPVPLRARAGMHVGPLVKRESTPSDVQLGAKPVEVVGIAKAITARLMALALGGQTLLSPQAHATLQGESNSGTWAWRFVSHGYWRMKGLESVVEVFEVGDEHSAFVPPADSDKSQRVVQMRSAASPPGTEPTWVGVRDVPNNLPGERDSFVGRTEQLKTVAQAFADGARLLTISGPGGMGKTRLALRYAWSWLGDHPGGVWFCDLASARGQDGLLHAVGQGLDVPLGPDALNQLGRAIAGHGHCLIILDNFEQLRRHARDTLGAWLDAAPQARFIVTSREVLGIMGERTMALAPLETKDAVALFHQRARAAHAQHDAAADAEATRELVDLLDGLPLAIELAAPRVRVMRTPELLARMGDRFRLLAGASGRPDRQTTLRATLAWSWELLSPDERSVLAQLSVFEGGFAWPAVQAVVQLRAGQDHADSFANEQAPWIIDLLQSLVDKSLVAPRLGARFKLLRSVQEFAAEELRREGSFAGSGAALTLATRLRHCQHFAGFTEAQATAGRCIEVDNLVAACEHAAADGHAELAVATLRLSWFALRLCGPIGKAVLLADVVLGMQQAQAVHRLWANWVGGLAELAIGQHAAARTRAEAARTALTQGDDRAAHVAVQTLWGAVEMGAGALEAAKAHLIQAHADADALGDPGWQRWVLNQRGALHQYLGQREQAHACYSQALTIAFQHADTELQAQLLGNLAGLHFQAGQLNEARNAYEQALALAREGGSRRSEATARCNLGLIHHEQGRQAQALEELQLALAAAKAMGYARLSHVVQCNLGLVAEAQSDAQAACAYFEAARAGASSSGDHLSQAQYCAYLAQSHCLVGQAEAANACITAGTQLLTTPPDPLARGLLYCAQADLGHLRADTAQALAALQSVHQLMQSQAWDENSELGRRVARTRLLLGLPSKERAADAD